MSNTQIIDYKEGMDASILSSNDKLRFNCTECGKEYVTYVFNFTKPMCPNCKKKETFKTFDWSIRNKKSEQTKLQRYGNSKFVNPLKGAETKEKRYGDQHYNNKEKNKQTNLEKYGVEYSFQIESVKNKIKQACIKKYGGMGASSDVIKQKIKNTNKKKYGYEYGFQSQLIKDKIKETNLEKYGVENPFQSEIIKDKIKETNLEKYGVEYLSQSKGFQNKVKQTCLDKYGSEYYTRSQEYQSRYNEIQNKIKETNLEKYGVENYNQSEEGRARLSSILSSEEVQTKINNTKRLNHTFNSSEIEELFSNYLDSQHIEYKRQYRSKEYPFNCDFYLPKYDLYIEIQASWTHGGHPYNEESDKDILESWKSKDTDYYNNAIETWTKRDVKKREVAVQNHLKYLEIFSNNIDETIKTFEKYNEYTRL